ncbi:BQ5605_C007g04666 [Microbotryum silenes-dioicae]|uniref:BQ5605_C007g04666 protein n=1 Tax=Microbotryum silenes-dioicae TaxID=796604 RepID=A0A2X0MAP3_9BASI|nr:BQ5605_C007g04666 [Microbotryum silenes-dioicae]
MFTARISSVARVALRASSTAPRTLSLKKNALLIPAVQSRYTNSIRLFNSSSLRLNDKLEATTAPTSAEEEIKADHSSVDPLASTESSDATPSSSSGEVYIDPMQAQADATANDGAAAADAPAQTPDPVEVASRTVFAGGLSWNVDVDWLRDEVATAIGSTEGIVSCRVARDPTGRSKGFGFIELTTVEYAQKLVEVSPVIDERETRFEISDPSTKKERPARERRSSDQNQSSSSSFGQQENPPSNSVWLGNLEWSTTEADLRETFGRFGDISRVHMPLDRVTQRSRGIAYIDYADVSQAEDAIAAAQTIEINGRYLRANYATRQAPFSRANGEGNRGGFNRRDGGESGGRSSYGSRGDRNERNDRNDRYGDRQSSYQSRRGGRDEGW